VVLDGRVLKTATPALFDTRNSPFQSNYAKPDEYKWSQILTFPNVPPAVFDHKDGGRPIQININEKSIYQDQKAVRRAGLVMQGKGLNGLLEDAEAQSGTKTFHWSVRQPSTQRLNFTHEYMNVFHVNKDEDVFNFRTEIGRLIAWSGQQPVPISHWKFLNRKNEGIWSTDIVYDAWQNFAVTLDFKLNTIQVWHSRNNDELKPVTAVLSNDNSEKGRFHVGIFKKPTGVTKDNQFLKGGYQERAFDEAQIYGGIFVEDSKNGCVTK